MITRQPVFRNNQMQRELAARLADQGGLEIISFQNCDCLLMERGEAIKMFLPKSIRVLGGTAQDRRIDGELLVIFETDLERTSSRSKHYKFGNFVASVPISNFPSIIWSSIMIEDNVDQSFLDHISHLLDRLPSTKSAWTAAFGEDFYERPKIDRFVQVIGYLKEQMSSSVR